jgi:tRNA-dihydrouridine synthase
VKLRTGLRPGDLGGVELARRLAAEGAVAGLCIHPRHVSQRHKGTPDYALARELIEELPVPVLISGGLRDADRARSAFAETGAEAIMLARGSLGNPWLFEELLGDRTGRYLRKFYPWYVERLGGDKALQDGLQRADGIEAARELLYAGAAV